MAFKVTVSGFDITASTPAEMAALVRELAQPAAQGPKVGRPPKSTTEGGLFGEPDPDVQSAIDFLRLLQSSADPDGASLSERMKALRVDSSRAIGGRMVRINNILTKAGLKLEDCYDNRKGTDGVRRWRSGPRLEDAVKKLEKRS